MVCVCYEVWVGSQLVASYWDVRIAWRVARAIEKAGTKEEVLVIVASGMQIDSQRGREKRTDVIGE